MTKKHETNRGRVVWQLATAMLAFAACKALAQQATPLDTAGLMATARTVLTAESRVLVNGNVEDALTRSGVGAAHRNGARGGLNRANELRQALIVAGHHYTGFQDSLNLVGVRTVNDSAILTVKYSVRFAHQTADPKSPKAVAESFNHDLVFHREASRWVLVSEREWAMSEHRTKDEFRSILPPSPVAPARPVRGQRGPPFNRNKSTGASGGTASLLYHGPRVADIGSFAGAYKPDLAITYARRWSNAYGGGYNPSYPDFGPSWKNLWGAGDDCTNFASQIVAAGGWMQVMHPTLVTTDDHYWWMSDESSYSHSWTVSHDFHWWMYYSGRGEFWQSFDASAPGDVVQFDWSPNDQHIDHTMVMTSTDIYDWYLTGHSNDLQDEPLAAIGNRNPGMALYLFLLYYNY